MKTDTRATPVAHARWAVLRTLGALALSAVLVPLGSIAVETAPITCGFGSYYLSSGANCTSSGPDSAQFRWPSESAFDYLVELTFIGRVGDFFVTFDDVPLSQSGFDAKLGNEPEILSIQELSAETYDCIPMINPSFSSSPCREFAASTTVGEEDSWTRYLLKIAWLFDTENNGFPNGPNNAVTMLHHFEGLTYDVDMCLAAQLSESAYVGCEYEATLDGDPFISSGDTDFSNFIAAYNNGLAVPEPMTIALLGVGSGVLWLRRRRGRRAESQSSSNTV